MKKAAKSVAANATKSWVTSLFGILTLAAGLAPIWASPDVAKKIQSSAVVLAGGGLIAAKDSNVSGK